MKKIIIAGGSGYLGSSLTDIAWHYGYEPIHVINSKARFNTKRKTNVKSIADSEIREYIKSNHVIAVINTVCKYAGQGFKESDILEANYEYPKSIIDATTGKAPPLFVNVDTALPYDTNNYTESKGKFQEYCKRNGDRVLNIRCEAFYGSNQPTDRFLSMVTLKLLQRKKISLSQGIQKRDYVYISDLIAAIYRLIEITNHGVHEYYIGGGQIITIREYVEKIASKIELFGNRKVDMGLALWGDLASHIVSPDFNSLEKIKPTPKVWTPKVSLDLGISMLCGNLMNGKKAC